MTATRNTPDPLYKHVVSTVLADKAPIKACLSSLGITTYRELIDLMKDHNKVNGLKWRSGSTDEDLPDHMKDQLKFFPSFLNYLQNNYGTMINHPIDIVSMTNHDKFNRFLRLNPTERCGNSDGTVDYDIAQARESEKFNQLGIFAQQVTPTSSGGSLPSASGTTSSTKPKASLELQAFEKKQSLSDAKIESLDHDYKWNLFHISVLTRLKIHNMDEMVKDNYKPPSIADGAHPDEVTLYEKRSALLYEQLLSLINTAAGKIIVREHSTTADGFKCWKKLEKHYEDDVSADVRAEHFRRLICTERMAENHDGYAKNIIIYKGWVLEYNHYCPVASKMDGLAQYTHFLDYIINIKELKYVRQTINLLESGITGNATTMTPEAKIDFYYSEAQKLDAERKNQMVERVKRSVNMGNWSDGELWDRVDPYSFRANVSLLSGDGGYSQNDVHPYQASFYDINAVLQEAEIYYGRSDGDDSEARRFGYLPKSLYQAMDPEHRKLWMSIPAKTREMIITYKGPPPPSVSEDPRIPGTGVAGRKSRATNQAEGELSVNVTESTIINAMKAASLRDRHTFDPARLMSKQNKSAVQLVPIERNLRPADSDDERK